MSGNDVENDLIACQENLNELELEFYRREFELKLNHFKACLPIYQQRDSILQNTLSREQLAEIYARAFSSFDAIDDLLPLTSEQKYDTSFIKFIKAEYLEGERVRVTLEMYENDYVKNSKIEKTVYLFDKEPEQDTIEWKDEPYSCVMFDFFSSETDCLDLFDIIFELYSNLVAYCFEDDEGSE